MKSVRLLPIVIFAASALLIFKVLGLASGGGYVLVGTQQAQAQAHGSPASGASGGADSATPSNDGPTMTDTSPVLQDTAPTLPGEPHAAAEGGEAVPAPETAPVDAGAKPAPPSKPFNSVAAAVTAPVHEPAAASAGTSNPDCPVSTGAATAPKADMQHPMPAPAAGPNDAEGALVKLPADCPQPRDAAAVTQDAFGNKIPLADANGQPLTDQALLTRLKQRSAELDAESKQLDMRAALLDAAQKKLDEREAALKALQATIESQASDSKVADTAQFNAVVSMYESMRPADAATIFNALDMAVLTRVAKAMNPRKMAPILAAMDPSRAQALTVALATNTLPAEPGADTAQAGQLPQIVGR